MNTPNAKPFSLFSIVLMTTILGLYSSSVQGQNINELFQRIELRFDTLMLDFKQHNIQGNNHFFLPIRQSSEEIELRWYLNTERPVVPLGILSGKHYEQNDSLLQIGNDYYRVRLKLKDLEAGQAFSILFSAKVKDERRNFELNIYPYLIPKIALAEDEVELFRGEEKSIEVITPNPEIFVVDDDWKETENYDYWLRRQGSNLQLSIRGKSVGSFEMEIPTRVHFFHPLNGQVSKSTQALKSNLNIKPSRLRYLNADRENIFYDSESRSAGEIQLDYDSRLRIKQQYRIEDANESAGRLVAEIVPKSSLGNDKILCEVFSYSHHRITDGYLYVKDGTRTIAMTNFNVVNRPQIQSIEMMREGGDWTENLNVFPGETVELRIRGNGLSISKFNFTPCEHKRDTSRVSDRIVFYTLKVPVDIDRRKVSVFFNEDITAYELIVREYNRPAPLSFIDIDYDGASRIPITSEKLDKPVFVRSTIQDITIYFDRSEIDRGGRLHGMQNIEIEVRVLSKDNQLLDIQTIRNINICPDETSPRSQFYKDEGCDRTSISLNTHLLRKTFALEAFDQIVIEIRHKSGNIPPERIHIYADRKFDFDVDISFPAGLLLLTPDSDTRIGNFTGVSTAFMAQFKFYSQKRIGQLTPFQIGAGFLALNAFNFSETAERDLGVVVLASIVPVRRKNSFSVPIYIGGGYLFNENQLMFLFGPGLQVRF